MCVIVGKPLDITPQIYQTQPVQPISKPVEVVKKVTPQTTKTDAVKITQPVKNPTAKTNFDFISTDIDKKTFKLEANSNNGIELNLAKNSVNDEAKIENAKLKIKTNDKTSFTGTISGELNKPKFDAKTETEVYGVKVTSTVNNSQTSAPTSTSKTTNKTASTTTKKPDESFTTGKTTGNIKTEIKANESLTITTEGQLDTEKTSKLGAGAKLKITKDTTAETVLNYDKGKTKAGIKAESKLTPNFKVMTELEHQRSEITSLKDSTSKASIKGEYSLHKDVKLTSGTNIDQTGKISGTLRGEAKLSTISISTGVETTGELSKNKYDAKLSGEVFKGFKVNAGVDLVDNKTTLKAGASYDYLDTDTASLKFTADTTGKEHSVMAKGSIKF